MKKIKLSIIIFLSCSSIFGGWFSHVIHSISSGTRSIADTVASDTKHIADKAGDDIKKGMEKAGYGIIKGTDKVYGGLQFAYEGAVDGIVHAVDDVSWRQVVGFTLYLIIDAAFTAAGEVLCGPPCGFLGDEAGSWIAAETVQKYVGTPNWQQMFGPYLGNAIAMYYDSWSQRGILTYQLIEKYSPKNKKNPKETKVKVQSKEKGGVNLLKGWPKIAQTVGKGIKAKHATKKGTFPAITKTQLDGYNQFISDPKKQVPGYIWYAFVKKYPTLMKNKSFYTKDGKVSTDALTATSYIHYYLTHGPQSKILQNLTARASDDSQTVLASSIGKDIIKPIIQVALLKGISSVKGSTKGKALEQLVGVQKFSDIQNSDPKEYISQSEMEFFLKLGWDIPANEIQKLAQELNVKAFKGKSKENIQKIYEKGLSLFLWASQHDLALVKNRKSNVYKKGLKSTEIGWLDGHHANLNRADLSKLDLSGANLSGADLAYANLENATLKGANLSDSDLRFANFQSANIANANLKRANAWGTNFNTKMSSQQFDSLVNGIHVSRTSG